MGLWTATAASLLPVLMRLLPQGPAWSREPDRRANQLLAALAEEWARVRVRANALIDEADPSACTELVAEWERVYGLPEFGHVPWLIVDRRAALAAKMLSAPGGQSAAYFAAMAVRMGCVGATAGKDRQAFRWWLRLPNDAARACCTSSCDAALVEFTTVAGRRVAQAATKYRPAHSIIFFDGGIAP